LDGKIDDGHLHFLIINTSKKNHGLVSAFPKHRFSQNLVGRFTRKKWDSWVCLKGFLGFPMKHLYDFWGFGKGKAIFPIIMRILRGYEAEQ
jgi:hypothetical protein